jgi:hypothetical protein
LRFAVVLPPFARHTVDLNNSPTSSVALSGALSMDLDNLLAGDKPEPGMGIDDYQWKVTSAPPRL